MNTPRKLTERDITTLMERKDSSVMRIIYDRYIGYMTAVCSRYIPDADSRKDVLQESFIKIITSLDRFSYQGEGSLRAWMTRITVNESLMFLRRNAALSFIEYDDRLPDMAEEPDVDGVPDDAINSMIQQLPPGYRAVLNLYVFENKSHREIAAALGITENTSASQYMRAKAALAKQIKEYRKKHLNT